MSGHTPGPWLRGPSPSYIRDQWGGTIAQVLRDNEDDALLIAAAPDLLEALKAKIEDGNRDSPEVWGKMTAAIAKATGGDA